MEKRYCGLDIHKDFFTGCIMDKDGNVLREHEFPFSKEAIEHFFKDISSADVEIAIEACGIWRMAYNELSELGYKVRLGHPKKTHDIACKKKTDKVDAKILADLLRTNYFPDVYIPDEEINNLRDISRHKCNLTRLRSKVQVKIKHYLTRIGVKYNKSLLLQKNLIDLGKLDPNLKNLINIYRLLKEEEKEVLGRIKQIAKNKRETSLLMSMPGIAEFSSVMILSEVGDIKRFKRAKDLVSYAGLCPGVYQSGTKERNVRNNAVNKWLKWILYECSGKASIIEPRFKNHYYRVKKKNNWQTARRSCARKMMTIIWHMLKNEEPYRKSS